MKLEAEVRLKFDTYAMDMVSRAFGGEVGGGWRVPARGPPGLCMKASEQTPLICAILFIIKHLGGESTDMEDKQGVLFSNLFRRPVAAVFDSPQSSSDGGSLLLKACDAALGLTETLASWLETGGSRARSSMV